MRFATLLCAEHIRVAPGWRSFSDTIEGLTGALVDAGTLTDDMGRHARLALLRRETESSTAVPEIGIAVPHARLAPLRTSLVALAVAPAGLYQAAPSVWIRIVALVLSPERATDEHLQLLAGVATSLRSPSLRAALLRAPDPASALDAIRRRT